MKTLRPRVAFFDFAGCEGCQLTVIDSLQRHPELLEAIDIVSFREASSTQGQEFDLAFVEGSLTRTSDEARLADIRERAKVVVALGSCACTGGVNAMRNRLPLEQVRRQVYGEMADRYAADRVRPISQFVQVDGFIPGCPIDQREFVRAVTRLLQGSLPDIPDYPVCVECKLSENACLLDRGKVCLGPVVRAGCGALCPSHNVGCLGCRGPIPEANLSRMNQVLAERLFQYDEASKIAAVFMSECGLEELSRSASMSEA